MKNIILMIFIALCSVEMSAQHYIGIKGGLGVNMQRWNNVDRGILFSPLVDVFVESHDDEINKLYASVGYHTRGSAVRNLGLGFNSFRPYKFNNIVLEAGFKQVLSIDKKYNGYYYLGGRAEYTASTNLGAIGQFSVYNLVDESFVRKFNYGLTIGGGFQYDLSKTRVLFLEASINPDASRQYDQRVSVVITNPNPSQFNPNQTITIQPQEVRNISLEIKIGLKFLNGYWEEDDEY